MASKPKAALPESELLRQPLAVCSSPTGDVFFADGHRVLCYNHTTSISRFCGSIECGFIGGDRLESRFDQIRGLCLSPDGELFIADSGNHCIRIVRKDGTVELYAGKPRHAGHQNGSLLEARFNAPKGLCLALNGDLLVADSANNVIRRISRKNGGLVTHFSGSGVSALFDGWTNSACFTRPHTLRMGPEGEIMVFTELNPGECAHLAAIFPDGRVSFVNPSSSAIPVLDAYLNFNDGSIILITSPGDERPREAIQMSKADTLMSDGENPIFKLLPEEASFELSERCKLEKPKASVTIEPLDDNLHLSSVHIAPGAGSTQEEVSITSTSSPFRQALYSQASIRVYLGMLVPCFQTYSPKDTVPITIAVHEQDMYTYSLRQTIQFKPKTKAKKILKSLNLHGCFTGSMEGIVLVAPDGTMVDGSERIGEVLESYKLLDNIVFLSGLPEDHSAESVQLPAPGSSKSKTSNIPPQGDTNVRVHDLRGPYVPRLPLVFHIARASIAVVVYRMTDARSGYSTSTRLQIDGGFTYRKLMIAGRLFTGRTDGYVYYKRENGHDLTGCGRYTPSEPNVVEYSANAFSTSPIKLHVMSQKTKEPIVVEFNGAMSTSEILKRASPRLGMSFEQSIRVLAGDSVNAPPLEVGDYLVNTSVKNGDHMFLQIRDDPGRIIYVKTLTGRTIELPGFDPAKDHVYDVFADIQRREGTPISYQRGIFAGKSLESSKLLQDYGVQNESNMHLVLRLRG